MGRGSMRTDNLVKKAKRRNQLHPTKFSTWPMKVTMLFWQGMIFIGILGMIVSAIGYVLSSAF